MRRLTAFLQWLLAAAGLAGLAWTHRWMGGDLRIFAQAEAIGVVLGGTLLAVWLSFPQRARGGALAGVIDLARRRTSPVETLVPIFIALSYTARKQGWTAVEAEIARMQDPFLARALTLSVSGVSPDVVRETLDVEARVSAERAEEHALVCDAAARYAPALGLLGALLALMRLIEQPTWSAGLAHGLASALVAVVYGLGLSSLVCQPLATRLRAEARISALRRDLTIHGVLALRDGAAPSVLEERLAGYLQKDARAPLADVA